MIMGRQPFNLLGKVFGKLTVIAGPIRNYNGRPAWLCRCNCTHRTEFLVSSQHLLRSARGTKCCRKCFSIKHGFSGTSLHAIWTKMRDRCNNKNNANYCNYGGRGITVCSRWNDFRIFMLDMGKRPTRKHSVDRINNNANYTPANCRWATSKQQQRNTRRNIHISYSGTTLTFSEFVEKYKLKYGKAWYGFSKMRSSPSELIQECSL